MGRTKNLRLNVRQESHVAVVASATGTAGREYLTGIFRAVNARYGWTLDLFSSWEDFMASVRNGNIPQGLITAIPHTAETLSELTRLNMPSAVIDTPPPGIVFHRKMSFPHLDDRAIGEAAAEHLLSRGRFNSFVCVVDKPQYRYPGLRESAFRERLNRKGIVVKTFTIPDDGYGEKSRSEFRLAMSQLQCPMGVFAVRDRAALKVYEACRSLKFSIPDEVAIIGVDNDEIFCETQTVTLSSIRPNHEGVGFNATQELERLMQGGKGHDLPDANSIREIVLRASTRIVPPTAQLIANALDFIRNNAAGRLHVDEIARHLGVSRRLLDLRFRQICGESVLDAIVRVRIDFAKRRLSSKGRTIAEIATACGCSSVASFTRFFREQTGITPGRYRHQFCKR